MARTIIVAFAYSAVSGSFIFHLSFFISHLVIRFEEANIFSAHTRKVNALKPVALPN
jgi:hypothetical protein